MDGLSLREILPKTQAQSDTFDAYNEKYNLLLHGCAGTGKTFISLYLALREISKKSSLCWEVESSRRGKSIRSLTLQIIELKL